MSHELTLTNGLAEMAYVGDTPWHNLGQRVERGATVDQMAIAANMTWSIGRSKVRFFGDREGTNQLTWDQHNVLFRSDTLAPLGLVSPKFKIVHPKQVLEFFRDLCEDNSFELETCGTLFGGRRFWALAKVGPSAVILDGADKVGGYLLLVTACDGTLATTARFTTICVVCNNTLSMALRGADKGEVVVSHRSKFDASRVKDALGIAPESFAAFIKDARLLADIPVTETAAVDLTTRLMLPDGMADLACEQAIKIQSSSSYKSILALFEGKGRGSKLPGREGTAWGWVNAVTEQVDHHARAASLDNRLDSAWFGRGDALKTKAVELANQLA